MDRRAVLALWMQVYDPALPDSSAARFLERPEMAELERLDDRCVARAVKETQRLPDILIIAKHLASLDLLPAGGDAESSVTTIGDSTPGSSTRAERRTRRRWWRRQ